MTRVEVDAVLKAADFSEKEIQQIKFQRQLIQGTVASTTDRELAAKLALVIDKPVSELSEVFMSSKHRQDADPSVTQVGWLNEEDDAAESLSQVKLEPGTSTMMDAYRSVKPGNSDLNLYSVEMEMFKKTFSQEQVEEKLHEILLDRYNSYRQKGLDGIPPYTRKGGKDYHPGDELKMKSELALIIKNHCPIFYRVLNEYPKEKPESLHEEFTWVNFEIDGKPTISLVHKMGMHESGVYVFCQRHFYVSRGHNSLQGTGGAFPIEPYEGHDEESTLLLYASRTSTDQVAGFGGAAKRAIGAKIMGGRIAENILRSREVVEKSG